MNKVEISKLLKTLKLCKKFLKEEYDVVPKGEEKKKKEVDEWRVQDASYVGSCISYFEDGDDFYVDKSNGVKGLIKARIDGTLYIDGADKKERTRADIIREDAQIRAALLEKYWECTKLLDESIKYLEASVKYNECDERI